jgi:hypothetical protein
MTDAERARDQANRLLAMALKAREEGLIDDAERFAERAAYYLDKAQALDPVASQPRGEARQNVVQRQQQPQPDDPEEK